MTVKLDNLAETFLNFWELAKDTLVSEQIVLWEKHYAEQHHEILAYEKRYNDLKVPWAEVFSRYPEVVPNIRKISVGAEPAIAESVGKCAAVLGAAEPSGRHIVLVGRFISNAWADTFEGAPTCFYALELIPDLDTLALMVVHETAHTLHFGLSGLPVDGKTVAETLLLEGLATMTSAVAVPGLKDEDYLWPGYETTTAGQKVDAWLANCAAQLPELKRQLLSDLDETDPAILGRYFSAGIKHRHPQTPVRAGYAVGYWLVEQLCQRYKLSSVVCWKKERVSREVEGALLALG